MSWPPYQSKKGMIRSAINLAVNIVNDLHVIYSKMNLSYIALDFDYPHVTVE
jgi:hypothetical protein